jgi:magnesium-transporting ATPase (P-type)
VDNWIKNGKILTDKPKPVALILDGASLLKISLDDDCKSVLTSFSMICSALIANRVSPDQKREIVRLVKTNEISIKLNIRTLLSNNYI